jgi:hypothetical protein
MASVLLDRLESIRRRHSRLVWLRGASVTASLFLGTAMLLGWVDWWVHLDDAILRGLLGAGTIGLAGWSAWRWWWRPAQSPPGPLDVALRLESRSPGLRDRLASGVEFASSAYATGNGSPALQHSLARELEREIDEVPWDDALDTRPVQRWATLAVATCLVAASCLFVNQGASWLAVRRLFVPFGAPSWPRDVNLRVLTERWTELERDPAETPRIPLGDEYRVYFENRTGPLPSRVFLESGSGEKIVRDALRVVPMKDDTGATRDVAVATLTINGPVVKFRGIAGDDTEMPFFEVRGIPAPRVEALSIRIVPPAYLSLPPRELPVGIGDIEAYVGSRIEVRGRSSRPLQGADARLKENTRHPATIDADGRGFQVEFSIDAPGVSTWWLDLVDVEGLRSNQPPKFELRAVPDLAPEVALEQPAADMQVTVTALVNIRALVKDDLGVGRVDLEATITGATERTESVSLWRRPAEGGAAERSVPVAKDLSLGDWRVIEGDSISLYVEAGDTADPEHVGRSSSRLLKVISGGDKLLELAQKQAEILEELDRARALEQATRDETRDLATQARETGGLREQDVETLRRLEHAQRQVAERLSKGTGSIRERVAESLEEFKANGLDQPDATRSLRAMADEIARLDETTLPRLEQQLTRARKVAETAPSAPEESKPDGVKPEEQPKPVAPDPKAANDNELTQSLGEAALAQDDVVESLSRLTSELTKIRNRRDTAEQVAQVAAEQKELNDKSAATSRETLGKSADDLTPQQRAEAAKFAERQENLAEKLESIQSRIEKLVATESAGQPLGKDSTPKEGVPEEKVPETPDAASPEKQPDQKTPETDDAKGSPEEASELDDALRQLRESSIAGKMRDAAEQLQRNQSAAATRNQREAAQGLAELERNLRSPPAPELDDLVKRERELEERLDKLLEDQAELLRKIDEAKQIKDEAERAEQLKKLGEEREQLRNEAERIARGLERLRKRGLAEEVREGAEQLRQAQQARAMGDEGAEDEAQEAVERLEQAQQDLAEDRAADEEQLAFEQLEKVRSALEALATRQAAAATEFDRLASLRKPDGSWTRAQLATLRSLATTEEAIGAEATALAEKIASAKGYALALSQTGSALKEVARKLAAREAGDDTRRGVQRAAARLAELVTLLAERQRAAGGGQPAGAGKPGEQAAPQAGGPPSDGIPLLAELKLVRTLQRELLERTTELSNAATTRDLTPAEIEELARLRGQQEEVADLARHLIEDVGRLIKPDDEGDEEVMNEAGDGKTQPRPDPRDAEEKEDPETKKPQAADGVPSLEDELRGDDAPRKEPVP